MFLLLMALNNKPSPSTQSSNLTPIPTPPPYSINKTKSPISVVSTKPADQDTEVDSKSTISITFNDPVRQEDVSVSFAPPISYTQTLIKNVAVYSPQEQLLPNLTYYGFVSVKGLPTYTFSFTTVSDTSKAAPDYANEIQAEINKHNYPDHYLASFMPYATKDFTAVSDYTYEPEEHFAFFITLFGDKEAAKQIFLRWALSTGLTVAQLEQLDIRFVN